MISTNSEFGGYRKMYGMSSISKIALLAICAILLAACAKIENLHGHVPDKATVAKVRPGVHDRRSVHALLGSPATIAGFKRPVWIYMTQRSERIAFLEEIITERRVLAVEFDKRGIVKKIQEFSLKDGRTIEFSKDKTITRGNELGVIEQLFGNFGRFNSSGQ